MIDQNNNINDKHIRDLLKWRLLEKAGEDDLLTQKLMDMEAKLAFSNEALYVPSLQKEKELLEKLAKIKPNNVFLKWILPGILIVFIAVTLIIYNHSTTGSSLPSANKTERPKQNNNLPVVALTDSPEQIENTISVKKLQEKQTKSDTLRNEVEEKWTVGDPGIEVDYSPVPDKNELNFIDYDNIPVLTEKQIAANNKQKAKMIRQLMKLDKEFWAFVPMSTDIINGKQISLNAFYMATTEVTNAQYHVFLNDLLIHDKINDYLKAVPDTAKWSIEGRQFFEPMVNNYFWHPAYADYPVVNVARDAVKLYCNWLTLAVNEKKVEMYKLTSSARNEIPSAIYMNDIRIPAEEEWVIAARAGKGGAEYPWEINSVQNKKGCFLCNFGMIKATDNFDTLGGCFDKPAKVGTMIADGAFLTAKVKSYNPNNYGLYNMSGNVAEMVWKEGTKTAITKGGSWFSDADHVKINAEENEGVIEASPYIGFRPVFTAKP